jgi:hypothetical protein
LKKASRRKKLSLVSNQTTHFFSQLMSGSVLLHRQRVPEDLQQLLAWYKIRDTLLGQNYIVQNVKKALELAAVAVSEHPFAVWLRKFFARRLVNTREEARLSFFG